MFRLTLMVLAMSVIPLAAQNKPPAHFPGSKGSRAGEYQAKLAAWQQQQQQQQLQQQLQQRQQQLPPPARFVSAKADDGVPPALRKTPPAPTPATVGKEIDKLDASIQSGVGDLQKMVTELEADRQSWVKLDKTVQTARLVNSGLLERARGMLAVYEDKVGPAMKDLKVKLKEAPAIYRRMATDRKEKAKAAEFAVERDAYTTQAEFCESAAALCERRHREVFESVDPETVPPADAVAESMACVKKMAAAHKAWAEVLESWPSTLNDPKLGDTLEKLKGYSAEMVAQQQSMKKLATAMKAAAEGKK